MSFSRIACLNLLLILSVHGFEVVARIRFQSSQYTVSEDSSNICIEVENVAAPAPSDFAVSYSVDSILIGSQEGIPLSVPRQGSLRFSASSATSQLCFTHIDNDIPCEPDIVGHVRLINSSAVVVIEPSTATVVIKDDDAASVGFKQQYYTYTEGGLMQGDTYPILQSSDPTLPATLQVSEAQHSAVYLSRSLTVPDTIVCVEDSEEMFQLSIQDDRVALEAPELVILDLSVVSEMSCQGLRLAPYNETQITILDDDSVSMSLKEREVTVKESDRNIEVCVSLSTQIARHLAFRLTVRNGTAKDGEDFTGRTILGQFMPLSEQSKICYQIPIIFDGIVEESEMFTVDLSIETELPNEVRAKLSVINGSTNVIIKDSSSCLKTVLGGWTNVIEDDDTYYVPESSTVCFDCVVNSLMEVKDVYPGVMWLLSGERLSNGDHFYNGRVLDNGTLMITNSSKVFDQNIQTSLACANNLADTDNVQQAVETFNILLGAPPVAISLVSSKRTTSSNSEPNTRQILTCIYEGKPKPEVEWLVNDSLVGSGYTVMESTVPEEENMYKSVLALPKEKAKGTSTYTCVCQNSFGSARRSLTLRDEAVAGGINASKQTRISYGLVISLLLLFCLLSKML